MGQAKKYAAKKRMAKKGQALTEYLVLVAIIGVASLSVVQVLSRNLRTKLGAVSESIRGGASTMRNEQGVKIQKKHYDTVDLGDFHDAIEDTKK